ncbi:MAG: HNH endonuclease signature motif containing protein, partial [Acidimicrobiia bacterium]
MASFSSAFDVNLVSAADALRIAADATAVANMAEYIKAMAYARAAQTSLASDEGDRSAAHNMARKSGSSLNKAKEQLEAAKKMAANPALDEAARTGQLSPEQTAAIGSADPDERQTEELIDKAKDASLGELKEECARTRARNDGEDAEARRRRIHAARRCGRRTTAEGAGELFWRSTPDELAEIWSVVQGLANEIFKRARAAGEREPAEAYAADALLEIARRAAGGAARAPASAADPEPAAKTAPVPAPPAKPVRPDKVSVRIDWDAFIRGWPIDGEVCEIAGIGPVPVSLVEEILASGDPFLAAVVTRGQDVINVAHLGRRATAHQRTALQWRGQSCSRIGCNATQGLQLDHRDDWATTKVTLASGLDWLCKHDHDKKTYDGWALVEGHGKRPMVPPDDPRHPRHRRRSDVEQPRAG